VVPRDPDARHSEQGSLVPAHYPLMRWGRKLTRRLLGIAAIAAPPRR
jgi:hypothetical protein